MSGDDRPSAAARMQAKARDAALDRICLSVANFLDEIQATPEEREDILNQLWQLREAHDLDLWERDQGLIYAWWTEPTP